MKVECCFLAKEPVAQNDNKNASAVNAPSKHYADLGPGFLMSTTKTAIEEQSTENCKCIKAEERCIQLGFKCLEQKCIKSELQCEEIDTVCTQVHAIILMRILGGFCDLSNLELQARYCGSLTILFYLFV